MKIKKNAINEFLSFDVDYIKMPAFLNFWYDLIVLISA